MFLISAEEQMYTRELDLEGYKSVAKQLVEKFYSSWPPLRCAPPIPQAITVGRNAL